MKTFFYKNDTGTDYLQLIPELSASIHVTTTDRKPVVKMWPPISGDAKAHYAGINVGLEFIEIPSAERVLLLTASNWLTNLFQGDFDDGATDE